MKYIGNNCLRNDLNYRETQVPSNKFDRRYIVSKPFRELRLRHHIIHGKQLKVLPREQISDTVEGVWNLASNQVWTSF